ncbi:MAG: hypothetical protein OHK0023_28250 [Anaerolineae bacterium]
MQTRSRTFFLVALIAVLTACQGGLPTPNTTPPIIFPTRVQGSPIPTFPGGSIATPTVPIGFPTPTSGPQEVPPGWNPIQGWTGVIWRTFTFRNAFGQNVGVFVARANPAQVNFRVHYIRGQTRTIQQWAQALPGAAMIINMNYYDANNNPLGLTVADGQVSGAIINRTDAGLFQVVGGVPRVRSLWLEPFRPGETFEQASQAFPILMSYGYVAPINPDVAQVRAARTVLAQDRQGRILTIITMYAGVTLSEMANWLGNSGLDIQFALNMDGGGSTALYLNVNSPQNVIASLRPIPVVMAVYPR